ncbi:MAG: hypothetical protein AAGD25_04880 [Cyanobacteria bacterium P01_F01_bin.150]
MHPESRRKPILRIRIPNGGFTIAKPRKPTAVENQCQNRFGDFEDGAD